jgi:HAD superfamily hydrolase (TIGR01509 family)
MLPPGIRWVLFDAGNTLMHLDYEFIAGVLTAHGHPRAAIDVRIAEYAGKAAVDRWFAPDGDAIRSLEGRIWPERDAERPSYFDAVMEALGVPPAARPAILRELEAHHRERNLWRVVESDTAAVLDALDARGLGLGVVSNADGRVEADLARFGLGSRLRTVVDSSLVGVEKPDPAIFALALERLGAPAAATLYVGDLWAVDVVGARGAGLAAALIDPLGCYPGPPDCPRIGRLAELLDLLPAR